MHKKASSRVFSFAVKLPQQPDKLSERDLGYQSVRKQIVQDDDMQGSSLEVCALCGDRTPTRNTKLCKFCTERVAREGARFSRGGRY